MNSQKNQERAKKYWEQMVAWRRQFHQIPELGMKEKKTTDAICHCLQEMGIHPVRLQPTGVMAYLGPEDGYTLALRADIDGLAVTEETGLSFASCHLGYMHACGHDGHIAGLLGAAAILKEQERELPIRVKLIFQPSEENTKGAKALLKQDVLHDVDAIFGLHLFSDWKTGEISVEPGPRMAQTDRFFLKFQGRGGHAGKPHQCVDASVMAADFIMSSQTIVSREIDPAEGAVVTIGSVHSGTQYNIISDKAEIAGTCRSFSVETAAHLRTAIEKRAEAIAEYYGGSVEIDYDFGSHPPVMNDPVWTSCIETEAQKYLGRKKMVKMAPMMLGEDFSWYQTIVPGVFAFVGCGDPAKEHCYPNHHPKFDLDENALTDAVLLHLAAVDAAAQMAEKI